MPKLRVCEYMPPFAATFNGMLLLSKDKLTFSSDTDLGSFTDINETLCDKKVLIKHKHHFICFYLVPLNPSNS